jgi:hypothetical protein
MRRQGLRAARTAKTAPVVRNEGGQEAPITLQGVLRHALYIAPTHRILLIAKWIGYGAVDGSPVHIVAISLCTAGLENQGRTGIFCVSIDERFQGSLSRWLMHRVVG